MGITLEQYDESNVIRLEGVIDITSAAELKATLLAALQPGRRARMALDDHVDLDVTAIQLIWAAEREARASGVEFSIEGHVPEPVSVALREAGFERFPVPH